MIGPSDPCSLISGLSYWSELVMKRIYFWNHGGRGHSTGMGRWTMGYCSWTSYGRLGRLLLRPGQVINSLQEVVRWFITRWRRWRKCGPERVVDLEGFSVISWRFILYSQETSTHRFMRAMVITERLSNTLSLRWTSSVGHGDDYFSTGMGRWTMGYCSWTSYGRLGRLLLRPGQSNSFSQEVTFWSVAAAMRWRGSYHYISYALIRSCRRGMILLIRKVEAKEVLPSLVDPA